MTSLRSPALRLAAVALSVGALSVGALSACVAPEPTPPELMCPDARTRVDLSAPLACDAATAIDPDAAVDLDSFRAIASAAVCDLSLRCEGNLGWLLAQSFCHPGFARYQGGPAEGLSYDAQGARACLTGLRDVASCRVALDVAFFCLEVSQGRSAGACARNDDCSYGEHCDAASGRCAPNAAGDTCPADGCGLGFGCFHGTCQRTTDCACELDADCESPDRCVEGVCRRNVEGEACTSGSCADGLRCGAAGVCVTAAQEGQPCRESSECARGRCSEDDVCVTAHHLGCGCASDAECPIDVSRCVAGACVARPMLGEACDPDGAPCFGSACYDGACGPIRDGDTCFRTSECVEGLTCSNDFSGPGRCGAPRAEGERCGPDLAGACGPGLDCTTGAAPVCAPPAEIGESCADRDCVSGAMCQDNRCVARTP